MGRLLFLLLCGIIFYFFWKIFFISAGMGRHQDRPGQAIDTMVLDPNCNTYIPRSGAIRKRVKGQEHYFCSKTCLKEYLRKVKS